MWLVATVLDHTALDITLCSEDLSREKPEVRTRTKVLLGARKWGEVLGVAHGQKSPAQP